MREMFFCATRLHCHKLVVRFKVSLKHPVFLVATNYNALSTPLDLLNGALGSAGADK
jgi:hypothetical protein